MSALSQDKGSLYAPESAIISWLMFRTSTSARLPSVAEADIHPVILDRCVYGESPKPCSLEYSSLLILFVFASDLGCGCGYPVSPLLPHCQHQLGIGVGPARAARHTIHRWWADLDFHGCPPCGAW